MFEAVKSLKETAISSGKSGSIAEDILKTAIERINASVEKLVADTWIGYPLHWVQAPHWDWVWSLDSGVCLCFSSSLCLAVSLYICFLICSVILSVRLSESESFYLLNYYLTILVFIFSLSQWVICCFMI